jgi:hypothetical protein
MTDRKPTSKVYKSGPKMHNASKGNRNNKGNKGNKHPQPLPVHKGKLV